MMPEFYALFSNFDTMRQIGFSDHVVNNQDVGFVRDMLTRQAPEFCLFIVDLAQLICDAAREQPADES